jgi:hypothetical protein
MAPLMVTEIGIVIKSATRSGTFSSPAIGRIASRALHRCPRFDWIRLFDRRVADVCPVYVDSSLRPECANSGHCSTAWLEGEIDPKPSSECARLPAARGFAVQTPLRRRFPTTEPNSPMPGRHGHSDGERNKRGDDHSDSNCPEPTSEPAFGFFRMGDRDILDQESDHIGAGMQHHPDSKAHKAALKVVPLTPLA